MFNDQMPPEKNVKFGFYSEEASKRFGSVFWIDSEGKEVEITAVLNSRDSEYGFKDKVFVGVVVRYSRQGRFGEEYPQIKKII